MPRPTNLSPNSSRPAKLLAALLLRHSLERCRSNADDFAAFCFRDPTGAPLRQADVHRELQAFLGAQRFALIELPRDHGKSVQACARVVWELGRAPGLRVKVVCASEALAAERGRFLRTALADNPRVRLVFPHLQPGQPWGETRFSIERGRAGGIGPSVAALGVGSAATGSRADLLVCDDIVDVKALTSAAERGRVARAFRENLLNLLEPDGRCWCLFTPWHRDDLNAALKHNPSFALFRRAVGLHDEPVWPEKWPPHLLAERRAAIGSIAFDRAYRLLPVAEGETIIKPAWVQRDVAPNECERIVLSVDPALSAQARADASALVVLGLAEGVVYCLEATARRVAMPELVNLLDDCDRRWQPERILFESNAAFAGVKDLLARHARFGAKVNGVTQTKAKSARVQAFSVVVENGVFRLAPTGQDELFEEMTTFPFAGHDDLLDAAATGTAWLLTQREPRVL